jgi:hypothetical protein
MEAGDDVLIITGEAAETGVPLAVVEALRYDRFRNGGGGRAEDSAGADLAAADLAGALIKAMEDRWGEAADILHVHNPLIQKNSCLLPALNILNRRGIRLLLQNHDLAEDFRPDVYTAAEYPDNCHYAVINSRDYSFLHRAGLKPQGLHLIPNEVSPIRETPGLARTRYLYPVRAIRRKNIGEALLLSLFIPPGRTVTITLPPTTAKDEKIYRRWIDFARELNLPMEFEAGAAHTLPDMFGSAFCIITTSVKEGFGFSFLEPWTAGRAVIGRRIDYVCRDFEDGGIRFDHCYSQIPIPMAYISPPLLKHKMEQTMLAAYEAFGLEAPEYMIRMMGEELLSLDSADFGCLDEELQEGIIRTLASNKAVFRDIADANPFLAGLKDWREDKDLIARNKQKVAETYGRERISALLRAVYQKIVETPVIQKLSKNMLLELYLDPHKLFLVGVGRD